MKKILVTGDAGFIGASLVSELLKYGYFVVGIDNLNDYYDVNLKIARLKLNINHNNYKHIKVDLQDKNEITKLFNDYEPSIVINLAAQAGVRYSITNPTAYIESNLLGFSNIIEVSRLFNVEHFIYASSSSVYGNNDVIPYTENQKTDSPLSLYAATKKSNELIAFAYSNIYKIKTTGLRLFTVYGPWGRPDMAYYKFTEKIKNNKEIEIYNHGNHTRDFTYIDDITAGIIEVLRSNQNESSRSLCEVYNLGNNKPIGLIDFIGALELIIGKKAKKVFLEKQSGDVETTFANINKIHVAYKFKPKIDIFTGLKNFVRWYDEYSENK